LGGRELRLLHVEGNPMVEGKSRIQREGRKKLMETLGILG